MSDEIIKRDKRGRFLHPPMAAKAFDSESGRAASARRWEITRRKQNAAIISTAKAEGLPVDSALDAWALVAARQFKLLLNSDKVSFAELDKLRRMITGADSVEDSQRANAGGVPVGTVAADPAALLELIRLIERERERARAVEGLEVE